MASFETGLKQRRFLRNVAKSNMWVNISYMDDMGPGDHPYKSSL